MPVGQLNVEIRKESGKGAARRLRAQDKIPGICYGGGREPLPITLSAKDLLDALDPERKRNTVITMTVGGGESITVMLKDYQLDPIKRTARHADFIAVSLDQEIHVTVPVVLTGRAEGVKLGGIMHQVHRTIEVAATPRSIPAQIELDCTEMGVGDARHVRDLVFAEGARPLADEGETVAVVVAPKAEKTEEVAAEGEEGEGVEAAAGEGEGEAGAEGAKSEAKAEDKGKADDKDKGKGKGKK